MSATNPETASRSRAPSDDGSAARRGSARLAIPADDAAYECARCAQTGRTCPSCVQRRRYAWTLVNDEGESVERAAMIMGVPPERVHALVEEERHRRELESFKCDSIPVELTRSAVEQ